MSMIGHVQVELDMPFPVAGVGFRVQGRSGDGTEGMTLVIGLLALEAGKTARCTLESSQPSGRFHRRLLPLARHRTKGGQVSHTDEEISGHFHPRYTVLQMLQTLQELCEMLDDKFAGYPASILS